MLWKKNPSNRELLERLESLERRFKTLLADVDEYFHLVRRAENRMAKKAAILEASQTGGEGNGQTVDVPSSVDPFSSLTPAQRRVQEIVMRRRAHLPTGGSE